MKLALKSILVLSICAITFGSNKDSDKALAFLTWFDTVAHGVRPSSTIEWYGPHMGFGVTAKAELKEGDLLIQVPLEHVVCERTIRSLTTDNAKINQVWDFLGGDDRDLLALWLMRERAISTPRFYPYSSVAGGGASSGDTSSGLSTFDKLRNSTAYSWWPYIDMLPRIVGIPATWKAEDLPLLQNFRVESEAIEFRQGRKKAPSSSSSTSRGGGGGGNEPSFDGSLIGRYNRLVVSIRALFADIDLQEANVYYAAHELNVSPQEARNRGFGADSLNHSPDIHSKTKRPQSTATPVPDSDLMETTIEKETSNNSVKLSSGVDLIYGLEGREGENSHRGLPGFGFGHDSLQSFVWAATLVDSRALTIKGEKFLVPFSDMLNYEPTPLEGDSSSSNKIRERADGANFLKYHKLDFSSKNTGNSKNRGGVGGSFSVYVDREIPVGNQVFEDYGDSDSGIYLHHHGMVPFRLLPVPQRHLKFVRTARGSSITGGLDLSDKGSFLNLQKLVALQASFDRDESLISTNPFDCIYLPLPTLTSKDKVVVGGGGGGDVASRDVTVEVAGLRRRLAENLGLSPRLVNNTCIKPPIRFPAASEHTDDVPTADPIPEHVHRWLAVGSLSIDQLRSSSCSQVLSFSDNHQHDDRQGKSGGQKRIPPKKLVAACLESGQSIVGSMLPSSSSHLSYSKRALSFIKEVIQSYPSTLAADATALRAIAHFGSAQAALPPINDTNEQQSTVTRAVKDVIDVLSSLKEADPYSAWLALAFRTTRKSILAQLLRFYERLDTSSGVDQRSSSGAGDGRRSEELSTATASSSRKNIESTTADVSASGQSTMEKRATQQDSPVKEGQEVKAEEVRQLSSAVESQQNDTVFVTTPAGSIEALVPVGLVDLPQRDAWAYITEKEHARAIAECDSFNTWFQSHNPISHIKASPVGGGMRLGAVTTSDIKKEEVYLAVPLSLILDTDSAFACPLLGPSIRKLRKRFPGGDEFHELLFHVITETIVKHGRFEVAPPVGGIPKGNIPKRLSNMPSRFGPYLDLLPTTDQMPFPCFFTDAELRLLKGSALLSVIERYIADIDRKYNLVQREVYSHDLASFPPAAFSRESYRWATAILDSRAIWWGGKRHLVPLLDLINCLEGPNPNRVHATTLSSFDGNSINKKEKGGPQRSRIRESEFAETKADRDYAPGVQVWENYGQPNWVYFAFHGFSLLKNAHDCVRMDFFAPERIREALVSSFTNTPRDSEALLIGANIAAKLGPGNGDYFVALRDILAFMSPDVSHGSVATVNVSASLYNLLLVHSKHEQGTQESSSASSSSSSSDKVDQKVLRRLERIVDQKSLALHSCISEKAFREHISTLEASSNTTRVHESSDSELEETLQFLELSWGVDRQGATILLRGIASAQLSLYATSLREDIVSLLADSAAQVVLQLADEEEAAAFVQTLITYAFGESASNTSSGVVGFETWRDQVLAFVRDEASGFARAKAALLSPRRRSTTFFLVTEKVQLLSLSQ
jgi:hypothetical protein